MLVPACRWTVIFHPNEKEQETKDQYEDTTSIFVMNNYFGIGIDAEISLDFHTAREEKPGKFQSRYIIITDIIKTWRIFERRGRVLCA